MGVYQNIYIGPYLKVEKIKTVITINDVKCLTNNCISKGKNSKNKFCPNCGEATSIIPRQENTKQSAINVIGDNDDWYDIFRFPHNGGSEMSKTHDFLLPNSYKDLVGIKKIEEYTSDETDLSGVDIIKSKESFCEKYQEYIDKIKTTGVEPEICYGIFIHYS